ncbi:TetR/AcrR family transcriptional regulator [Halorubrum ezzemoulense]|uniref:Transcriptional regulator n=1 Tax=Halorubrum ezzemoulense TaxID=337243 RepID=A0A256J976_HALEZ|nr:TetR/AcrR family transcriptional regulator [Halorubrum ezzemoulense]OYR65331.1 transcriptional regulator [Halorubrum ezzemoulense]
MAADAPERDWSAAEAEIMEATYRALLEHGYAGLSISRIAAELGKSKAAIYYHYDAKDELLATFLEFAVDRFEATVATETGDEPTADLEHVIEKLLPLQPDEEQRQLQAVLVELRSQAVTNEVFREQFTWIDDRLAAAIRDIVERGIDEGTFRDVDPSRVAEHVLATVNGAMYARATTDRESAAAAIRVSLASYIDSELRRHP